MPPKPNPPQNSSGDRRDSGEPNWMNAQLREFDRVRNPSDESTAFDASEWTRRLVRRRRRRRSARQGVTAAVLLMAIGAGYQTLRPTVPTPRAPQTPHNRSQQVATSGATTERDSPSIDSLLAEIDQLQERAKAFEATLDDYVLSSLRYEAAKELSVEDLLAKISD